MSRFNNEQEMRLKVRIEHERGSAGYSTSCFYMYTTQPQSAVLPFLSMILPWLHPLAMNSCPIIGAWCRRDFKTIDESNGIALLHGILCLLVGLPPSILILWKCSRRRSHMPRALGELVPTAHAEASIAIALATAPG